MTELELYKFVTDHKIEWHRHDHNGTMDVLMFPRTFEIEDFIELLSAGHFDDGGVECRMMNGYFAFWMNDICEYYGIDVNNVFGEEE